MRTVVLLTTLAGALLLAPAADCQTFGSSGTTNLSVTVAAEASLYVSTATTALTSTGTLFSDYTGTTNFVYKIRTSQGSGSGNLQLRVTSDFSPSGGPSVADPPSPGDKAIGASTIIVANVATNTGSVISPAAS